MGKRRVVPASGRVRHRVVAACLVLAAPVLVACQTPEGSPLAGEPGAPGQPSASPSVDPVRLHAELGDDLSAVSIEQAIRLDVTGGAFRAVTVTAPDVTLPGALSADNGSWTASGRLEPSLDYLIDATIVRSDGSEAHRTMRFHTQDLTLDQQTFASIAPLQGETVGVGMPVIVTFDVPVTDKASIERHMSVTATPAQQGSWHWFSDTEVHYRPRTYWQAGSQVSVDLDINSIPAGGGIYGQESRHVDFQVGDAHIYKVNAVTHQMQVFDNGTLLRTIPITTGKDGFITRSGVKVIIEKFDSRRMNSETVGIPSDSPDAYDIDNVQWAMRLTWTGEFIHAAPWSVGSQGYANVSHGCTGMSTDNAKWLYDMTRRGDVAEYTGTDKSMTIDNGFGDWNVSFAEYREGSALR